MDCDLLRKIVSHRAYSPIFDFVRALIMKAWHEAQGQLGILIRAKDEYYIKQAWMCLEAEDSSAAKSVLFMLGQSQSSETQLWFLGQCLGIHETERIANRVAKLQKKPIWETKHPYREPQVFTLPET